MANRPIADLHRQLHEQIATWIFFPYLVAGFVLAVFDPENEGFASWSTMGLMILAVCALAWAGRPRSRTLSVWILNLGGIAIILIAWRWFPRSNAHHALIYPILCASLVSSTWSAALLAFVATAASLSIAFSGPSNFGPTSGLVAGLCVLWSCVILFAAAERPRSTLLGWTWEWYSRAQENLEAARDRQVELKQAIEDLALAHREVLRLNDLLTAAREAIESARRAKEEFVANVSHELRTPLNMIIGYSDEILERPEVYAERLPEQLLGDIGMIKRNSEHLASLVDDVLELAEADAGYTHLFREWISLPELVIETADHVRPFFEKKGLYLTTSVTRELPSLYCDRVRIRQVLLNLLSNAARFTQEGGANVEVRAEEQQIAIAVQDTGPGIDSTQLARLFEPFQQADPMIRRRYGGTGLGLAISKRFIEMHGGHIEIASQLGLGTTVTFRLPQHIEATGSNVRRAFHDYVEYVARDRASAAPQSPMRPQLLVVEEEHTLSSILANSQDVMDITHASSCAEAEAMLEIDPAIAIIINQPLTTSKTSEFMIPACTLDVPVLTCWLADGHANLSRWGVEGYLLKPILGDELYQKIAQVAPQARHILLVDDDDEARRLYRWMLQRRNPRLDIVEARDGDQALAAMTASPPDLLLLDLMMPGTDGLAVLAQKSDSDTLRDVPVIILSARDPERQPLTSPRLCVTRQSGLTPSELSKAIQVLVQALPPRFARHRSQQSDDGQHGSDSPTLPETDGLSQASG